MFEPPDSIDDFNADAEAAEIAQAERQLAERKAELARKAPAPQVIDPAGNDLAAIDDTTPAVAEDEPKPWPHQVVEIQGHRIEVKKPSAAAMRYIGIFGFGEAAVNRGDFSDFMNRHVSPKSVAEIRELTYNGEIEESFYDDLMKAVFRQGTGRPTGPSSASQRSR